MKKIFFLLFVLLAAQNSTTVSAQTEKTNKQAESQEKKKNEEKLLQHGRNFVDKNGDGYNDNAPDDDGDGIPNALDPDFKGPRRQKGKQGFVDLNGDGINDNNGILNGNKGKNGFGPAAGKGKGPGFNNRLKAGEALKVPVKSGNK